MMSSTMFHIELRQPPHRLHRFNLSEQELRETVLAPWVRGERLEIGERGWSADAGAILVLEGPEIPIGQLTMNRGWSVAQREGRDVTERVLAGARGELGGAVVPGSAASAASGPQSGPAPGGPRAEADVELLADALGLELLRGLGETPMSLLSAWRAASRRYPQTPPGTALDLAQRAVASLARSRLITVSGAGEERQQLQGAELDAALSAGESWTAESGARALWIRRS
jgi:hypothetical protein